MTNKTEKDLLNAASNADYKAIQECLADWVDVNAGEQFSCSIQKLLAYAGLRKGSDTQTMDCIELLYKNGADLNYVMGGSRGCILHTPLDVLGDFTTKPDNPKDLYNAVKFVLTHGGKNRDNTCRKLAIENLEYTAGMSKEEFETFEYIGTLYSEAKKAGKEFDLKHAEETINYSVMQSQKRDEKIEKDNRRRKGLRDNSHDYFSRLFNSAVKEAPGYLSSLAQTKEAKEIVNRFLEQINKREKEIIKSLQHGIPERDEKAQELKGIMRDRDTSGKKINLKAYLKERSEQKPLLKNSKFPKRNGNEGM